MSTTNQDKHGTGGQSMKRLLVLLVGLFLAGGAVVAPTAAYAQEYPPAPPAAGVSDGTVSRNGTVTFSGMSTPFDVLTITVTYASGASDPAQTVTADASGAWSLSVALTRSGVATLAAAGSTGTVTRQVVVLASSVAGSGQLATTGLANGRLPMLVLIGAGIVLLGVLLVFTGIRWRRRTAAVR